MYEIIWGCREVDEAVNHPLSLSPKGIIVNFGGAEEGLGVQGEAPSEEKEA